MSQREAARLAKEMVAAARGHVGPMPPDYEKALATAQEGPLPGESPRIVYSEVPVEPDGRLQLLVMSDAEKAAHLEFRDAAREARSTQEAAQKAAVRYAAAVKRLSEVCAPPATIEG